MYDRSSGSPDIVSLDFGRALALAMFICPTDVVTS